MICVSCFLFGLLSYFCIFCDLLFHVFVVLATFVFFSPCSGCSFSASLTCAPCDVLSLLPLCFVSYFLLFLWSVFSCVDLYSEHVTVLIFSPAFFSPVTFCYLALDFCYKDFQPNFSLFVLWSSAVGSSHTSSLSLSLDPRVEKL